MNAKQRQLATRTDGTLDLAQLWSQGQARTRGSVWFSHSPVRLADIANLVPYGLMVGGHVCPIDHGYFYPKKGRACAVLAPAAGFIVMVGHRTKLMGSSEQERIYDDYALTVEHSGTFYTVYDLLTKLDDAVLQQLDTAVQERFKRREMGPPISVRIPVKAGQVMGQITGRSLDFGVINTEVKLPGFLTPRLYGHYAWRVHVVDPFDYFDEPLRGQLLRLNPRKVKPYFGKIDYDIDGKIVGNWFQEGTGGYPGNPRDPRGYWMTHLALAYHPIDPTLVIVSVGDFGGRPQQFAVRGNGPDPARIGLQEGLVKYALQYAPIRNDGQRVELPPQMKGVQGVLLLQLIKNRQLKAEAFPGRVAGDIGTFTAAAQLYER